MPTLEQIASEVVLFSPDDGAARQRLEKMLRDVATSDDMSGSVRDLAWQAMAVVQGLMQSKHVDTDLTKLNRLLDDMMLAESQSGSSENEASGTGDGTTPAAPGAAVDEALIREFLLKQETTLGEFESDCLALEGGDTSRLAALKRQIHTWKGEAGILGLRDLSAGMHRIEEDLHALGSRCPAAASDALLELKDKLSTYFADHQAGTASPLDVDSVVTILQTACESAQDSVVEPTPDPEPAMVTASSVQPEAPPAPAPAPAAAPPREYPIAADIDMELTQEFRVEAAEHFQQAETALMALENDPSDAESVNVVFRAFHTVKGVAGFIGLPPVSEVAHKAETFFDRFRKNQLVMQGAYTDLAFEALDMLKGLVQGLMDSIAVGKIVVPGGFGDLLRRLENPELALKDTAEAATKADAKVGEILIRQGKAEPEDVDAALRKQRAGDPRPVGEILVEQHVAKAVDVAHALRSQQSSGPREGEPEGTVKVYTSRLDSLINMVGELVIAQSMVSQDPYVQAGENQRLVRNVTQLNKITRSLQELTLSMRMVSVKATFQKMARLVRDLARKSHKEVVFETEGEDTELDRNMVEAMADPLVHMVRNAVDHGLEPTADRATVGKPRQGRILLRAAHEGGSVVIHLSDDGRGLNREKILAKAVERGLVESGAQLSDHEIHNLIFMPGFSTADKVTDVSGRGVGMDVVRTNVEAMRGTVEIFSKPGEGSVFSVRLPLTLAIIDGMVIQIGQERFVLSTISITETLRPRPEDVSTVQGQAEMVLLRGDLIPIMRLGRAFCIPDALDSLSEGILVVTESKGRRIALLVDELLGQQQVVIKSLGSIFRRVLGVSGGAILGDGRVCLILDVEGLMRLSMN